MESTHTYLSEMVEESSRGRTEMALDTKIEALKDLATTLLNEVHELGEFYNNGHERRFNFYREVRQFEIDIINCALRHCAGNQARAAQLLGLNPTTLHAKIKQYGISINRRAPLNANNLARYSAVRNGRALADLHMAGDEVAEEAPSPL